MNELAANLLRYLIQNTIEASLLICIILLIRIILRERLTVRWQYALWFLVCMKILIPWTPTSAISLSRLIPEAVTASPALQTAPVRPAMQTAQDPVPWSLWSAIVVWICGMSAIGVYLLKDHLHMTRLVNRCPAVTSRPVLDLLEDCCHRLHITRSVRLIVTDAVKSPALLGMIHPKLLLPTSMMHGFTKRQLRHVFFHELAHLKRHDIAAGSVVSVCHLIHWFNPLVWYAFQLMRTDRELACDQVALTQLARSEESTLYGQTILRILEFNRCHPMRAAIAGMGQTKHQVRKRIVSIAEFKPSYEGIQWGAACLLACLAVTGLTRTPLTRAPVQSVQQAVSKPPLLAQAPADMQTSDPSSVTPADTVPPPQTVTEEATIAQSPAATPQEVSPEQHPFMLSQEFSVGPPQIPGQALPSHMAAVSAQMRFQVQFNSQQMQIAQGRQLRQMRYQQRTINAQTAKKRKRPTAQGIPGIVEMAARQAKLNKRR